MKMWKKLILILVVFAGCKKPYFPSVIASSNSYLVVEGIINNGADSTIIKLTRTTNLSNKKTLVPELHAVVTVESNQNTVYPVKETKNGYYGSAGLNLNNNLQYRLRIKTSNNQEYLSDFVAVINSPPIDSINFTISNNGINLFANTHDATNKVKYYRWDFKETWIFHSNYQSAFKQRGDSIYPRDLMNDNIYNCWGNDTSANILLGSSAKLAQDVIASNPLTFIPSYSEKLGNEYSVEVQQYALSGDAYSFWSNLKKNTEQLGSIFDAEPSQINGNIHCITNPLLPVIGYISVGATTKQRIFIRRTQLPHWETTRAYPGCSLDTFLYKYYPPDQKIPVDQVTTILAYHNKNFYPTTPVDAVQPPGGPILGYSGASIECVDCTLRGTNKLPAFWQY